MKKILILSIMAMIFIMPLVGAVSVTIPSKGNTNPSDKIVSNGDFTHTVLAEYAAKNTCPFCEPFMMGRIAGGRLWTSRESEEVRARFQMARSDNKLFSSRTHFSSCVKHLFSSLINKCCRPLICDLWNPPSSLH